MIKHFLIHPKNKEEILYKKQIAKFIPRYFLLIPC
nr:MAG TPA: hypothetical protein [Caudoviricetes sp.]